MGVVSPSISNKDLEYPPLVLQQNNQSLYKTNYFINLLMRKRPMQQPKIDSLPLIVINLVISKKLLFFKEFFDGFTKQDYPKKSIIVHVIHENDKNIPRVDDYFKDMHYHYNEFYVINEGNYVKSRIKSFKSLNQAEKVLYFHSSVILRLFLNF